MIKITDVELIPITNVYEPGWGTGKRSYGITRVKTEDGRIGLGESYCAINMPLVCKEAMAVIRDELVGGDAEQYEDVMFRIHMICEYFDHRGMIFSLLGSVDWALHDLAAQRAGVPLHKLLNPNSSDSLEIYASTGAATWPVDQVIDDLETCMGRGFRTAKIRVTTDANDVASAIQRIHDVFARLPDGLRLGVDPAQQIFRLPARWPLSDSKRLVNAAADYDLRFLEDVHYIADMDGYVALCKMNKAPIAGGEQFHEVELFQRYFEAGAFHVAQPDASVVAGPKQCMRIGELAEKHGVEIIMHGWAGPVAQMQNLHVALALPECDLLETATNNRPLNEETIGLYINPGPDGRVPAPTEPGMGLQLGEDFYQRHKFQNVSTIIA